MKKQVPNPRDVEAEKYALSIIPRGDYEFEGTFRGYVEEYPSEERREIQEFFKAGWDARDKLDNEALKIAVEALLWCEEMLRARDEMNSKVHCAPVRLSPITERVVNARAYLVPLIERSNK